MIDLDTPVSDLPLPVRAKAGALRNNCNTVGKLASVDAKTALQWPNFGPKSLMDIADLFDKHGIPHKFYGPRYEKKIPGIYPGVHVKCPCCDHVFKFEKSVVTPPPGWPGKQSAALS